jgi:hypothetical protein
MYRILDAALPSAETIAMRYKFAKSSALLLLASLASQVSAAPITFPFRFADPASSAQAVGSITFEDTLLANPGSSSIFLPDPAVLALSVTVSGSAAGDGTFGIADFTEVVFDTNGGTLNFNAQLVGQPTAGGSWGTPDGNSGDFNLFSGGVGEGAERYADQPNAPAGANAPPNGVFYFTLGANGGADEPMVLTAMGGGPISPPATLPIGPGAWLALAGLLALGGLVVLRRRSLGT